MLCADVPLRNYSINFVRRRFWQPSHYVFTFLAQFVCLCARLLNNVILHTDRQMNIGVRVKTYIFSVVNNERLQLQQSKQSSKV